MPGRSSLPVFARGLGALAPLTRSKEPSASTSFSDDAESKSTSMETSASRARSVSKGGSSGRVIVRIVDGRGAALSSGAAQLYCLLEVNATTSKSTSPLPRAPSGSPDSSHNLVFDYTAEFDLNDEDCEVHISIYDRAGASGDDEGGYIGGSHATMKLSRKKAVYDQVVGLIDRKGEPIDGVLRLQITYEPVKRRRLTPEDFEVLAKIGEGAFGTVFRVRKRDTERIYAMKVLSKERILNSQTASHVLAERKVLQRAHSLNSPFLVSLKFSFQTETHLYLVMDYKPGGELFTHLAASGGRFREEHFVRFYLAEILLALAHLHERQIVYRDLKPENILLDAIGHIALCDFGLSKPLDKDLKTNTFCGTGDYLAPETILDEGSGFEADWWAYGVLAYEIFNGYTPFYSENKEEKYRMILNKPVKITGALAKSAMAGDLVRRLLCRDPAQRLGANGAEEIKAHPFFASIDWAAVAKRRISPPFKPPEQVVTPVLSPSHTDSISSSSGSATKPPISRRSSCELSRPHRPGLFLSKTDADLPSLNEHHWQSFTFAAPGHDSDTVSLASFGSASSVDSGRKSRRWSRRSSRQSGAFQLAGIRNMLKMTASAPASTLTTA